MRKGLSAAGSCRYKRNKKKSRALLCIVVSVAIPQNPIEMLPLLLIASAETQDKFSAHIRPAWPQSVNPGYENGLRLFPRCRQDTEKFRRPGAWARPARDIGRIRVGD
jgi:hypothetical protein